MIITSEKIEVTWSMLEQKNMTRGSQIGVPVDANRPMLGVRWKELGDMSESDFDTIEDYFLKNK